ncbi:MAG: hypothetical protein IJI14_15855 [Anaerolineaceae bacterium]|nr:hypothetical protein [Anaerolineaceae bacterium]
MIKRSILSDDSGQGSIEYLLISIAALVISGIFILSIRDGVLGHSTSIENLYDG